MPDAADSTLSGLTDVADANLRRHLRENPYPGRGLILGRSADGAAWVQVYWIMGRSENSRNRRFVVEGASLRTEAVDPSKLSDPTNVIYEALLELPDLYVVSNGDQTRTVVETMRAGGSFEEALETRAREDDAPNYTPRISGLIDLRGGVHGIAPRMAISILRASDADASQSDRVSTRPALPPPGFGLGITTYAGDGDPLPSFRGDPIWLPLAGGAGHILATYWEALNADNRVALAVKTIPVAGGPGSVLVRNALGD
jgi:IMP cyclohydrolase